MSNQAVVELAKLVHANESVAKSVALPAVDGKSIAAHKTMNECDEMEAWKEQDDVLPAQSLPKQPIHKPEEYPILCWILKI